MSYSLRKPEGFWARAILSTSLVLGNVGQLAFGQFSDGKIAGTVYDSSKAASPEATVQVKDERTGVGRTVITNELGAYLVPQLKPSTYQVNVTATGFEGKTINGVAVGVGQARTVDFTVNPAGSNEEITVSELVALDTT